MPYPKERQTNIRNRGQIYGQTALGLAVQIQEQLNVELAAIINPVDLTLIGAALYDPEELYMQNPKAREHAEEMLGYLTSDRTYALI